MEIYSNETTTDTRTAIENTGWNEVFADLFPDERDFNNAITIIWKVTPGDQMTREELDRAVYETIERVTGRPAAEILELYGITPTPKLEVE